MENDGTVKPNNEEIIVTERPMVNWAEVVGLDSAKESSKRSYSLPCAASRLVPAWLATRHSAVWSSWLRKNPAGSCGCN